MRGDRGSLRLLAAVAAAALAGTAPRAQSGDPEEDARMRQLQTTVGPRADEVLAAVPRGLTSLPRLHEYVTPVLGSMPLRLGPGTKGEVRIALAVGKSAALAAGAHLELGYERRQGALLLGQQRVAADARELRDGAVLVVPVEVDPGARVGNHGLLFTLEADLVHERDRAPLGRFSMRFGGRVEIAAQPVEPGRGAAAGTAASPELLAAGERALGPERASTRAASRPATASAEADTRDEVRAPAGPSEPPAQPGMPWLVGAVAIVLLGLLHLLGRARRPG